MFTPRYFPARYFAPRFFAVGAPPDTGILFASRYFPARYFAPRFFPGVYVAPPAPVVNARLLIGGVDASDYLYYGAPIRWNLLNNNRGSATLPLVLAPDDTFAPMIGDAVQLFDPLTTRCWSGSIEAIGKQWLGDDGWRVFTATCISYVQAFDTTELDKIEYGPAFTCGEAFADIYDRSGVTEVTLGIVEDGPAVSSLQVSNGAQGFNDLALLAGFVWYVDPADNTLNFHRADARAADWELESTDVLWETLDYRQSRADYRDKQFLQLPGVAQSPITASFPGDGSDPQICTLPSVPSRLISVDVLPGGKGILSIAWVPGDDFITVTGRMLVGNTLVVTYAEVSGQTSGDAIAGAVGIGSKTARHTKTRTFTPAGGVQENAAILARYSMLPATLQFSTDKPGLGVARVLTIALDAPLTAAASLNGDWIITEIEAAVIPGLDLREEPWGHFRYTIHLTNTAATAVFRGDGATSTFLLPEIPGSVPAIRLVSPTALSLVASWAPGTNQITTDAPLPEDAGIEVDYRGAEVPEVPSFVSTWEQMTGGDGADRTEPAPDPLDDTLRQPDIFQRTVTIYDTAVADDIAPHTPVYHDGVGLRLLGVLRKAISADLTVRINKANVELITVTIPLTAMVDEVFEWGLVVGSPPVLDQRFYDKEVLTADILESDGSTDVDGVAQFTVEWTF